MYKIKSFGRRFARQCKIRPQELREQIPPAWISLQGDFLKPRQQPLFPVNSRNPRLFFQPLKKVPGICPGTRTEISEESRDYADLHIDAQRKSLIAVCEDHDVANREPENSLLEISLVDCKVSVLASGYDFYSSPRHPAISDVI